jgi:hypothetical protein
MCGRNILEINNSVETLSLYSLTHRKNMKYISEKMLAILERLSEMFPGSSYQSRLDSYLSTKGITDAAQLENYIKQFNSQKESYL